MEDLQSSLNQAKNILRNNNITNYENVFSQIKNIYNSVEFENQENSKSRKDVDIPALIFWYLGGMNLENIQLEYTRYCNTPSLYSKNYLSNWSNNLQQEIKSNKMFKPSPEKTQLITSNVNQLIVTIHYQYPFSRKIDNNAHIKKNIYRKL